MESNLNQETVSTETHNFTLKVCLAALILGILVVFYYTNVFTVSDKGTSPDSVAPYTAIEALRAEEPAYQKMNEFYAQGNGDAAIDELEKIQEKYATGTAERNTIDYDIAIGLALSANSLDGIDNLKKIVLDDVSYTPLTRALAVEALGRSYFTTHDPQVTERIFSGDLFQKMLTDSNGDAREAVRTLLAYGLYIKPTAISAVRLAGFSSAKLARGINTLTETEKDNLRYEFKIYSDIGKGEAEKMEGNQVYNLYLSEYYSLRAIAMAGMVFAQENVSKEETEAMFEKAYTLGKGGAQVFALFNYGSYLSRSNSVDTEKINSVASRIVAHSSSERELFNRFIINALAASDTDPAHQSVVAFQEKSSVFSDYVTTLK